MSPWLVLFPAALLAVAFLRRRLSQADFFAADHGASAWLSGLAGTAIGLSAFTFIGGPALVASVGSGALWMILPAPLTGVLQCWLLGRWLVGRQPRPVSLPQLLAQDLSPAVRPVAALLVAAGCLAGLVVQAKAIQVLAQGLLREPGKRWMLAVFLATMAYVAAGGMRVAVWVDAVQGAVMGAVALVVAWVALRHTVAAGALLPWLLEGGAGLGSFGQVPATQAFSWYLLFTVGTLAQPHYLQKFFFLRSQEQLRWLPLALTCSLMVVLTVWVGLGLAAGALVQAGLLPPGGDGTVPLLLRQLEPGVLAAAALGALFAISSTVASLLNLLSAALTWDLPQAFGRQRWSLAWGRLITLLAGLAALALAASSGRTVALLGLLGWGFFTAAFLPAVVAAVGRWPVGRRVPLAMVVGAGLCLGLEALRAHLPAGLEPGLVGAGAGFALLALSGRTRG